MAEVIDVVERVARAIYRQLGGGSGDYDDAARAAFAAMLEAVGEPVEVQCYSCDGTGVGVYKGAPDMDSMVCNCTACKGRKVLSLYSLAALEQD